MNRSTTDNAVATEQRRKGAGVRGLVLGLAFFAAGIALSAAWFMRAPAHGPAAPESAAPPALSEATRAILQHLGSPVEIRFYSLLDPASIGDSGREFSGRVDQLLAQYEQEAGGKIKVARVNSISYATAHAAEADGIKAFNKDKGEACYLGLAVVRGAQKESLSSLAPEWELALESDLSRAIARAVAEDSQPASAPKANPATLETVKRLIPNVDSISVDQGKKVLRQASLAEFKQAVQEMQAKVKAAEEKFLQAQADQSEAGQEAARKELAQIQADHLTTLRRLTAASQAQTAALEQIKGAAH
jgi:hypothetical protein